MAQTADQYFQSILDAKKNYNSDPKKYSAQSNAARDALKQMGIDTSTGAWASGTDYRTADQQYLTDKYQQQVKDMYSNLQNARLGELHASQKAATDRLNQQKAEYGQQIHGQKDQAEVRNKQAAKSLSEIMAAKGIGASGENVTANVGLQADRQNALNGLDQQYNNYSRDIGNQISAINDPSKEQSIIADIAAQQAQAQLNAQQTAYNQAMQEANTSWNQNFQQSQADRHAYEYSHMSAAQKAQMDQAASQFGQTMAWQMWDAKQNAANQQALLQTQLGVYGGGNFPNNTGGGDLGTVPTNVQGLINNSASKYKLNPQLLTAVIKTESGFNPTAKSSAGAYGLMQLMPWAGDARYSPATNVDAGSKFLSSLINKYGDIKLALAAYNSGGGTVDKALAKAHSNNWNEVSKYLPKETRNYVPKVLSYM